MAKRLGVTEGAVRAHAEGRAGPRRKVRARYRELYGVPEEAWDAPATPAATSAPPAASNEVEKGEAMAPAAPPAPAPRPPPVPKPLPDAPKETDALNMVLRLLATAQAELEQARGDTEVPYNTRASLITSATRLCQLLARLSGQLEITHAAILRSAAWARITRTVDDVVARHPEAVAAFTELAQALDELGE